MQGTKQRTEEIRKDEVKKTMQGARTPNIQWSCSSCGFILGYVNQEKTEIRMKAKDFFVTVEGGRVTHPCRHCGKLNELVDEDYLVWKTQEKILLEFIANRKLFEEYLRNKEAFLESQKECQGQDKKKKAK